MDLLASRISNVSVLKRMLFACTFLPQDHPRYWEVVSKFASECNRDTIDPQTTRLMMENLQLLNSKAFAQDQELSKELKSTFKVVKILI